MQEYIHDRILYDNKEKSKYTAQKKISVKQLFTNKYSPFNTIVAK